MAAPTSVRCEATSIATVDIRWDYAGGASLAVYLSTDGISYSEITTIDTRVAAGTTLYTSEGLTTGTKYWIKLTDDAGSTFSLVVTVWTHSCAGPVSDSASSLSLPPFLGDDGITAKRLNEMQRRIEAGLEGTNVAPDACTACPVDGAIALDCSSGCINWTIVADEDINSISIDWCEPFDSTIEFIIPPNTTVGICGFPAGFGFTGDECTQAPISGGTNGRTVSIGTTGGASGGNVSPGKTKSKPQTQKKLNSTSGGAGGAGCLCVPRNGALTIKSCNANNSLNCSTTKTLKLIACGGRAPYTWSRTGTVQLKGVSGSTPGSTATGGTVTVTPPTNAGGGVGGMAYWKSFWVCSGCSGGVCNAVTGLDTEIYGCDDALAGCTGSSQCSPAPSAASMTCGCGAGSLGQAGCGPAPPTCDQCGVRPCGGDAGGRVVTLCDKRTAQMITDGCVPCGVHAGDTVSVTDAIGVVATIIVRS